MTTTLEGGEWSASRSSLSLTPGKTWYPLYRRLCRPQGRFGQVKKTSPPPGFYPRTVQPAASRYTDDPTREIVGNHKVSQNDECVFSCILSCFKPFIIDMPVVTQIFVPETYSYTFNPLKPELNPICYLLALLGAHHFLHVSRIRVK
jgi:hypothetical protein